MSKEIDVYKEEKNFTAANIGAFDALAEYSTGPFKGKVFLKEALKMTGSEISLQLLPAGFKLPFAHSHKQNEEVYIILKGKGVFEVDGVSFPVSEGSVVRVAPAGSRILASAPDSPMTYMVIQTKAASLQQWTEKDGII